MRNTIKTLIVSTLTLATLATLALSAVAQQPQTPSQSTDSVEQPVTTIVETLPLMAAPQQPLITQENVPADEARVARPRGESRTTREQSSRRQEKPLVEVTGF